MLANFLIKTLSLFSLQPTGAYSIARTMSTKASLWAPGKNSWLGNTEDSVAEVIMVPMFRDNYGYLLIDPGSNSVACVDPGDGEAISKAVADLGLNLSTLLCTHKHSDHVGGNLYLKNQFPNLNIVATKYEEIPGATTLVGDGDVFHFGDLQIRTFYTPCHTKGHVLYLVERKTPHPQYNRPILFSGDTLFAGGCGRFFEGTANEMQHNMEVIAQLPPDTQIYCAHEYTESNYKFLASIDPELCQVKYEEIQAIRRAGRPTLPSLLSDELQYNLFMQCHTSRLQAQLGTSTSVETMAELRSRKNNF